MPDFLIQVNASANPAALLALAEQPYAGNAPRGRHFKYSWGAAAVLNEKIGLRPNVVTSGDWTFAWVGELLFTKAQTQIGAALAELHSMGAEVTPEKIFQTLRRSGALGSLNGAFAGMLTSPHAAVAINDPMGSVQLYAGKDTNGRLAALGTHPDLVARLSGPEYLIDPVSVCEFINMGTSCCPHTMFSNVREIWPGTVSVSTFSANAPASTAEFRYWEPPSEAAAPRKEQALVKDFVDHWQEAITSRSEGERIGIQLSGGMDSRLVLAAVPQNKDCVTVTLCDSMNREARFAKKVAQCYGKKWVPLSRDPEYLGRTLTEATRFAGCEGEFSHGHTIGFAKQLREMQIDSIFTGLLMDNNFKGYYARDFVRVGRLQGLLPARHKARPLDYVNQISEFCKQQTRAECVEGSLARRRDFQEHHFAQERESRWEWLDGFPYSQSCDNTGWVIERRLMPIRLPVMDRNLVDLAFRVPMSMKAGGRFFELAAVQILKQGCRIPSANDGVRLGSTHVSRLLQRAVRKTQTKARNALSKAGFHFEVPHSWHDFPKYLQESPALTGLIFTYGEQLKKFEGSVFKTDPALLIRDQKTPWPIGYRLIQLAVWRGLLDTYAK